MSRTVGPELLLDLEGLGERWPEARVGDVELAIWLLTGERRELRLETPGTRASSRGWLPWAKLGEGLFCRARVGERGELLDWLEFRPG